MNLAKKVTLAASVMFAMALTLSCSSDDDNGGSSFNENSQIYKEDDTPITNDGVIKMRFTQDDEYTCANEVEVGSVTNGVVTLDSPLPVPPEDCLIISSQPPFDCSSWPEDLKSADAEFILYEGEESMGRLEMIYFEGETFRETAKYAYSKKNATITCNDSFEFEGWTETIIFNMNVKTGWNKLYEQTKVNAANKNATVKGNTSSNILTKELKWILFN